ncbi:MAG: CDP-glycerol glycerophosphotransferase family protein, partial [Fibrobacter sp.]|nr:CDP-glycerol glycerophosphotransferase family protein [Fibrobacter sp.]
YSESGQDWHHFEKIVKKLLSMSRKVCYLTSDPADPGLSLNNDLYKAFFIKDGFWQITLFQFLKADCLVLTMIDLDIFQLKRSINPVHYIYLFHAMGSTHMVDFENSYDRYDSVLCVGPHQIEEIRKREQLKNLPAKNLIKHGYCRVEELMEEAKNYQRTPKEPYTVLLAPTWGDNSTVNICGKKLVGILLDAGLKVIFRPHYQTVKLTPHIVNEILDKYSGNPLFSFVNKMGDTSSLYNSDLLICDWSSTSIEYALGLEKPVLYIDVPKRIRNPKYEELGIEPMEISIRNKAGKVLGLSELEKAPEMIRQLLAEPQAFKEKITKLRSEMVFNLGNSVAVAANEIIKIADTVNKPKSPDKTV